MLHVCCPCFPSLWILFCSTVVRSTHELHNPFAPKKLSPKSRYIQLMTFVLSNAWHSNVYLTSWLWGQAVTVLQVLSFQLKKYQFEMKTAPWFLNSVPLWLLLQSVSTHRGHTVYIFSFQARGVYNKMASLSPEQLAKEAIALSAGHKDLPYRA